MKHFCLMPLFLVCLIGCAGSNPSLPTRPTPSAFDGNWALSPLPASMQIQGLALTASVADPLSDYPANITATLNGNELAGTMVIHKTNPTLQVRVAVYGTLSLAGPMNLNESLTVEYPDGSQTVKLAYTRAAIF